MSEKLEKITPTRLMVWGTVAVSDETRTCAHCGRQFGAQFGPSQINCSPECSAAWRKQRRRQRAAAKGIVMRTAARRAKRCVRCDGPLGRGRQKYCGSSCAAQRVYEPRQPEPVWCRDCKTPMGITRNRVCAECKRKQQRTYNRVRYYSDPNYREHRNTAKRNYRNKVSAAILVAREMGILQSPKEKLILTFNLDELLYLRKWPKIYKIVEFLLQNLPPPRWGQQCDCCLEIVSMAKRIADKIKRDAVTIALQEDPTISNYEIGRAVQWRVEMARHFRLKLESEGVIRHYRPPKSLPGSKRKERAGFRYVLANWQQGVCRSSAAYWHPLSEYPLFPDGATIEWTPTGRRRTDHRRLAVLRAFEQEGLLDGRA